MSEQVMGGAVVETASGKVRGLDKRGIQFFKGIPYAGSTEGRARFQAPRPVTPWTGVRDADRFSPVAPQPSGPMAGILGSVEQVLSEDCLSLNVVTPACDGGKRPVMVWIHGGGFTSGTGATPWYDGRPFAQHGDVVVVTINYRLGALGFTHLGPIGGDAYADSGNAGILDQVAALRWVQENIAGFGGDPGNVTIFGESAGGMSVGTLLGTPEAKGLFHKAIPQSGAASNVRTSDSAAETTSAFLFELGIEESAAGLEKLADVPMEAILAAQVKATRQQIEAGLSWAPVLDGTNIPEAPLGNMAAVPTLTGTTLDEMNLFLIGQADDLDLEGLARRAARLFPARVPSEVVDAYRDAQPSASPKALFSRMMTDVVFRIPAIRLLEAQVAQGAPAWSYLFSFSSTAFDGKLGACHALEIPFVFDTLDRGGVAMLTGGGEHLQPIADAMHQAWIRFAHDSDPGWAPYEPSRRTTMNFDVTSGVVDDPMSAERQLFA